MPSHLDSYRIVERVQEVSGATWYRAYHDGNGVPAVLIVFEARRSLAPREEAQQIHARADQTDAALRALEDHPKVPHYSGALNQVLGVSYRYQTGIPLSVWVGRYGDASHADILSLCVELLDVLAFAHDRGQLHRSLSPAMVWVADAPALSLCSVYGFGVADLLGTEKSWVQTSTVRADVRYMAPEQFTGERLQPATDLYAVGLLAHRLLRTAPVFEGASVYEIVRAHCDGDVPALTEGLNIHPALRETVSRALRRTPSERYVNAREMMHVMREELRRATRSLPQVQDTQRQYTLDSPNAAHEASPSESETPNPLEEHRAPKRAPGKHARAVDVASLDEPSKATEDALNGGDPPPPGAAQNARRVRGGFPWRTLMGVWLVALVVGLAALWGWKRTDGDANTPNSVGATNDGPAQCQWEHVVRSVRQGATELELSGPRETLVSYDRMNVRVMQREDTGLRPIRYIRAFGSVQMWHRYLPASNRDWVFFLPRVRNVQQPRLWALQFEDGELLTTNRMPLSQETVERAHVKLRVHNNTCVLWVRVEGDTGPGPRNKEMRLRMVDPGLVVESGALGRLWAPSFDESPL